MYSYIGLNVHYNCTWCIVADRVPPEGRYSCCTGIIHGGNSGTSMQQSHLAGAGRRAIGGCLHPLGRLPSMRPGAVNVRDAIGLVAGPPAFGDRALRDLSRRFCPVHRHVSVLSNFGVPVCFYLLLLCPTHRYDTSHHVRPPLAFPLVVFLGGWF